MFFIYVSWFVDFLLDFVGIVTVFASGWLFCGSVPGWPMRFLCDVFIAFCWFLCDCLEFVGVLWCLLLVCPKQQLLSFF